MFASCPAIFGFRRRENDEEQDAAEEAEAEFMEQQNHLYRFQLLECSSNSIAGMQRKKDYVKQLGKDAMSSVDNPLDIQPASATPMIGNGGILGFQDRKLHADLEVDVAESALSDVGVLGLTRDTFLGFQSRNGTEEQKGGDTDHQVVVQQRDRDFGILSSSALALQMEGLDGNEPGSESSDLQYIWGTGLPSSPVCGFQRWDDHQKQEGKELESKYLNDRQHYGVSSVARLANVGFPREQSWNQCEEGGRSHTTARAISLPDELVEKIISMMPYPEILNARLLNKSWYANFSSTPDAMVFQNQVTAVSANWKHYCPVILNIEKEWLVGFDRQNNRWQKLGVGFEREVLSNWFLTQRLRGAGSLMCGVFNRSQIFVTNIVTGTWKWLPSRPNSKCPTEIHLLPVGSDAYRVLLLTKVEKGPTEVSYELYDSRMESWTIKYSTVNTALLNSSSVYLNGVLYVMEYDPDDFHDVMKMLSYNVEDGTWTVIPHPFGSMLHEIETYELLVCQSHVMVILHLHTTWWFTLPSHNTLRNSLMVYKLDPVSLDIREVSRGPPELMSAPSTLFASDNDCIYFGNPQVEGSSVVELNIRNREWSCLPPPSCSDGSFKNKWVTFSFQPGLNPFVLV